MRFASIFAFSFAAFAVAQTATSGAPSAGASPNPFHIPREGLNFEAGETTEISWDPTTDGTVTLILRSGPSGNLEEGEPIAENIPNSGSYSWRVPASTVRGSDYTIEIVDDTDTSAVNFTPQFVIDSDVTVAPSSSASESASATETEATTQTATETETMTETATETDGTTLTMRTSTATTTRTVPSTATEEPSSTETEASVPTDAASEIRPVAAGLAAVVAVVGAVMAL